MGRVVSNGDELRMPEREGPRRFTWAGWTLRTDYAEASRLVNEPGFWMEMNQTTEFRFVANWGTKGRWHVPLFSTGAWTHIAVTYDFSATTNDPSIYIDGFLEAEVEDVTPAGAAQYDSSEFPVIGNRFGGDRYWRGEVAQMALWNVALDQSVISDLANGANPLAKSPSNLVYYLPIYGDRAPEPDESSNENDALVVGTLAQSSTDPSVDSLPGQTGSFSKYIDLGAREFRTVV